MRPLTTIALALAAGGLVALSPSRATSKPVLHEYVAGPRAGDATSASARSGRGHLPPTIRSDRDVVPRPSAELAPQPGEAVRSRTKSAERESRVVLDRKTTHNGRLNYTAEFNPTVLPFKRMAAFDAIAADGTLRVRDPALRPVALARRKTPPNRTPFWGSVVLRLAPGRRLPLPSVAPNARIVSYEASPGAALKFYRDSADNFWVSGDAKRRVRVVFLTDAPRSYFSPRLPRRQTTADIPVDLRPTLPAIYADDAARVIRHIGVRRRDPLRAQLSRLVAYFRNFRGGRLESRDTSAYRAIALSQRGVCKHRSFAFVVTAHALGIPARYVHNEAHAFVEVYVPRTGWVRVDLGGAPAQLRVDNRADKKTHRPGPDPFPKPRRYTEGHPRIAGAGPPNSTAAPPGAGTGAGASAAPRSPSRTDRASADLRQLEPPPPDDTPANPSPAGAASSTGGAKGSAGSSGGRPGAGQGALGGATGPLPGTPGSPARPTKLRTRIDIKASTSNALRGDGLRIWGRVTTVAGVGVANVRVAIFLVKRKAAQRAPRLAATVTKGDGRYEVNATIPADAIVGDYELRAATDGDRAHERSVSR